MTIVFETPTLIDPRAFTIGGLTAKPNSSNPIGRFGTGLKYAIAVLVRMGADPTVWIGRDKYVFKKRPIDFRGKSVDLIEMHLTKWSWRKPRVYEMPFTTEYGRDWKPWMVFRELEANTRDEGGWTLVSTVPGAEQQTLNPEHTCIVVDHPDFSEAFTQRETVFLPPDLVPLNEDDQIQQFAGESRYLYWRGMRVLELGKPSLYTWNIKRDMELTEDRTLRSEFLARTYLAEWITRLENEELIKELITAKEKYWESSADFGWASNISTQFRMVARSRPEGMLRSAQSWVDAHEPQTLPDNPLFTPWRIAGEIIYDCNERALFHKPYSIGQEEWEQVAVEMVRTINE